MKNTIERRRANRTPSEGDVILVLTGHKRIELQGSLLDTSRTGFRATHAYPELSAGIEVSFTHQGASGRARVIWTRILGEQAESGFLILE